MRCLASYVATFVDYIPLRLFDGEFRHGLRGMRAPIMHDRVASNQSFKFLSQHPATLYSDMDCGYVEPRGLVH
jgi:hypothetical protein